MSRILNIRHFDDLDEALLFDVFIRVVRDCLGRSESDAHSFDAFLVEGHERTDGLFLHIQTGVGFERVIEWDGTIADAIKEVAEFASTVSTEL
jgi:hypothetical protein